MTEENVQYWELIIKEQAEILEEKDQKLLDSWKNGNPAKYKLLIEIYQSSLEDDLPNFKPEDQWEELQTLIKIDKEEISGKTVKLFPWFARAAAALLIIIGVVYIINYQFNNNEGLIMQKMVSTDGNFQEKVTLPDGTIVWLNTNSEILFPEKFSRKNRVVYLKGEAYFEVTHDEDKPFVVQAGISKTTVIGTSFNLRAYSKEDDIRLTVVSGKVAFTLSDDRERVIVTPGNMASLNRNLRSIQKGQNHDLNFLSWKTKELKFDDCPIQELVSALQKYYGIEIQLLNDDTNTCRFTGDFKDTELENALKIITKAIGTSYEKTGNLYVINGEGCY